MQLFYLACAPRSLLDSSKKKKSMICRMTIDVCCATKIRKQLHTCSLDVPIPERSGIIYFFSTKGFCPNFITEVTKLQGSNNKAKKKNNTASSAKPKHRIKPKGDDKETCTGIIYFVVGVGRTARPQGQNPCLARERLVSGRLSLLDHLA
jgi:hypothetical protein